MAKFGAVVSVLLAHVVEEYVFRVRMRTEVCLLNCRKYLLAFYKCD